MIVCPEPSTNITALTSRGYESAEHYYKGKLFANAVSWAGNKTENEKTVVQEIATVKSVKDCEIVNSVHNGVPIRASFKLIRAMSPYHICCKVIPPIESKSGPLEHHSTFHSSSILQNFLSRSVNFNNFRSIQSKYAK